jgi:hypothetical protein
LFAEDDGGFGRSGLGVAREEVKIRHDFMLEARPATAKRWPWRSARKTP